MFGVSFGQTAKPLFETYVHDPVVIKQDNRFYLFCTGNGITVYSSNDLNNWKPENQVFDKAPEWTKNVVVDFKNHIWAPDISFHNGQYYLYYSVSSFAKNTSAIGVATNKTLDSKSKNFKWVDHGIVIESVPNRDMWNAIDPNLIFDENNTPYLSLGSFWSGLKLVKLNKNLTSIAEPQEWHTIAKRERSFKLDDKDPGDAALEAPFIFKKDGFYYLFVSFDLCCRGKDSTYKVVVGRSEKITGPYVDDKGIAMNEGGGKLLIEGNENWFGAGHNSVYSFDGKDYIFYHAYDAHKNGFPVGQKSELIWTNGWPSLLNPLK
jgi:arabinan endo-1,5-alpha-L-arabinosidase